MQPAQTDSFPSPFTKDCHNLDVLRTIAVLCVVCQHVLYEFPKTYRALGSPVIGKFGVLLFFIHTSLVLMLSLSRQGMTSSGQFWQHYKTFITRRAFRIYPLSIFVVLFLVFLVIPLGVYASGSDVTAHLTQKNVIANLLLVQNLWPRPEVSIIGPLWSLPVEVQMYLLLPLAYVIALRYRERGILILWGFLTVAAMVSYSHIGPHHILKYSPCFIAGVLCWSMGVRTRKLPHYLFPVALVCIAIGHSLVASRLGKEVALGYPVCLAIGYSLPYWKELPAGLFQRTCLNIAKYSYGIYLFHDIFRTYAFERVDSPSKIVQFLLFAVLTAAASVASYHLIESPLIGIGNKVAAKFGILGRKPTAA